MLETPPNAKSLAAALQPTADWTKRVEALRLVGTWATAEHTHSSHAFVSGIHELRDAIADQVGDLRSAVVKEACATIAILASTMKDAAFQAHVDTFLASLLKALVVSVEVVSGAADSCIRTILVSTRTGHHAVLPKVVQAATSRSPVLRRCAVEYLGLVAASWNTKAMLRHNVPDTIAKLLLLGLCDGNCGVRAASRKSFWTFQARFPAKAKLVWEKLDAATKNALLQGGAAAAPGEATTPRSPLESDASSTASDGLRAVFARLYQPHYFQERAKRLAKLKEAQELRLCTFTPVRRLRRVAPQAKHVVTLPPPPPYVEASSSRIASTVACS
ncbi:CLIP-associating protein [Achlya hypogyna]|uniref:CLIP-associating protein n=1 Tax=Achlya hypogyna TaxID=1202772 RepID=A0A1V9YR36_ACHHY|nr:CLIP-associating protein [Achlya hypogyna]